MRPSGPRRLVPLPSRRPPSDPRSGQGWENVNSLADLKNLGWSKERPLRVVTGYTHLAKKFFKDNGLDHVNLSTADGALEAAPAMGSADVILDLVRADPDPRPPPACGPSAPARAGARRAADAAFDGLFGCRQVSSGTTLRENNLKQIQGGRVLESQGVLVASRKALLERQGALATVRDIIERVDGHLRCDHAPPALAPSRARARASESAVRRV